MSAARSAQAQVRNPMLALAAMQQLQALPPESRAALAAVLEELAQDSHARAEKAWRSRKGPMAAYWRAVGVYARHTARAVKRGPQAPAGSLHRLGVAHWCDQEPCPAGLVTS